MSVAKSIVNDRVTFCDPPIWDENPRKSRRKPLIAPWRKFGVWPVPGPFGASRLAACKIRLTGVSPGSRVRGARGLISQSESDGHATSTRHSSAAGSPDVRPDLPARGVPVLRGFDLAESGDRRDPAAREWRDFGR